MRHVVTSIALLSCLGTPCQSFAQRLESVALLWDNDILALRGTGAPPDYDYTHGLQLTAVFRGAVGPLRRSLELGGGSTIEGMPTALRLGVGQRIYTPRQDAPEPVPGERPYADWLYAVGEVIAYRAHTEHHVVLELGITGPAALGEQVQNGLHRLVGATLQQGWAHQLHTEPAAVVRYRAARQTSFAGLDLRPHVEIGAGTLWTGAAAGIGVSVVPRTTRGPHASAQARQEWVVRNLFLDGNTFRSSVRADKRHWVSEGAIGVGYRFDHWDVAYRFVIRSAEYRAQPGPHGFGSLMVVWHR